MWHDLDSRYDLHRFAHILYANQFLWICVVHGWEIGHNCQILGGFFIILWKIWFFVSANQDSKHVCIIYTSALFWRAIYLNLSALHRQITKYIKYTHNFENALDLMQYLFLNTCMCNFNIEPFKSILRTILPVWSC
jgi:hypothetical protein